jgi:hypothetical protein
MTFGGEIKRMEITPYFCISDPYHQLPVFFPNLFRNHPVYQKYVLIRGVYVKFFGKRKSVKNVFFVAGFEIHTSNPRNGNVHGRLDRVKVRSFEAFLTIYLSIIP